MSEHAIPTEHPTGSGWSPGVATLCVAILLTFAALAIALTLQVVG